MESTVHLCAPAYAHGRLRPISAIPELERDPMLCETLNAVGLETFSEADQPLVALAATAVQRVLSACDLQPTKVDAVVYASTLYAFGKESYIPEQPGQWLGTLVETVGMQQAAPYGVSFAQCVNIINAIELAQGLLAGGKENVLVVTADQIHPSFSRVVAPGISVTSDVASAVLLSTRPRSRHGFRLGTLEKHVDWALLHITPGTNFPDYVRRTVEGMKVVAAKLYAREGCDGAAFAQLITNTINRSVCRIFSQATGIPTRRIYADNVARIAHCDAADLVVNLADYGRQVEGEAGARVLAIANGPHLWGGMTLTSY